MVNSEIRELAQNTPAPIFYYGLTQEDLIFYLSEDPKILRIKDYEEVVSHARKRDIVIVTDKKNAEELITSNGLVIKTLEEFPQPRGRNFLFLSIDTQPEET